MGTKQNEQLNTVDRYATTICFVFFVPFVVAFYSLGAIAPLRESFLTLTD
jgi:hypothetical protein